MHTFNQFWICYLRAHALPETRTMHYFGITFILIGVIEGIFFSSFAAPLTLTLIGALVIWSSHYFIEKNQPMMFAKPTAMLLSFACGLRMYGLGLTGHLQAHLDAAGVKTQPSGVSGRALAS